MAKRNWRGVLRAIHRDLGYACVGLILVYAISGVAVNHVDEWNPNYEIRHENVALGPIEHHSGVSDATVQDICRRLQLSGEVKTTFQRDPNSLRIILEGSIVDLNLKTGRGVLEHQATRPVIYESNVLHLNHVKGAWTWVADLFAVALAFLAISGALILKGRQGLFRRGLWFTIGGFVLPVLVIVFYLT